METVSCHMDIEQTFQPAVTRPEQTGGFLVKKEKSISKRENLLRGGRRGAALRFPSVDTNRKPWMFVCQPVSVL